MKLLSSTANLISLGRALLGPVILLMLMTEGRIALYLAFLIICLAAASDLVDGYLARRIGPAPEIGRYLDEACDAIFNFGVFLGFLYSHWLPVSWFLAIYFAEIIVPYLGAFAKQMGQPFDVRWSARFKTIFHTGAQIVLIAAALSLPNPSEIAGSFIAVAALGAAVVASLIYMIDHAVLAFRRTAGQT